MDTLLSGSARNDLLCACPPKLQRRRAASALSGRFFSLLYTYPPEV